MKKRKLVRNKKSGMARQKKIPAQRLEQVEGMLSAARQCYKANLPAGAEDWCRQALALDPGNSEAYNLLGMAAASLGRKGSAMELIGTALSMSPENPIYNCNMGIILAQMGQVAEARACFETALAVEPDNAGILYNLIELYEKTNQLEKMRECIRKSLGLKPDSYSLKYQLAKLEYREGNYPASREIVANLLAKTPNHDLSLKSWHLLAQNCDRLGDNDEAYRCFENANRLLAASPAARSQEQARLDKLRFLDMIRGNACGSRVPKPGAAPDCIARQPIFVVGFPRSGTTLTGQLLGAHPAFHTLDEEFTLAAATRDFFSAERYHLLFGLGQDSLNQYRQQYVSGLRQLAGDSLDKGVRIVDKNPLYICYLEMIDILLPGSRVIVIHRDPRDVCLSNFMQDFVPTPFMNNFLSLENTVNFYEKTMGLFMALKSRLSLSLLEVRYEDIVADLQAETEKMLSFLGEQWDEGINEYYRRKRDKQIITPSYQQVNQPIYGSSIGRWKRYQKYLEPFLGRLQVYVRILGYE